MGTVEGIRKGQQADGPLTPSQVKHQPLQDFQELITNLLLFAKYVHPQSVPENP